VPFNPNRRIWILTLVSLGLLTGAIVRLGELQIFQHTYYEALAENQRQRASQLRPHRGTVYVKEGRGTDSTEIFPVATNERGWIVYAVPRDIANPEVVAKELAPALIAFRDRQEQRAAEIIASGGQERLSAGQAGLVAASPTPAPVPQASPEEKLAELTDTLKARFDQATDPYEPLLKPYEIADDDLRGFLEEKKLPGIVLEEQEVRTYPEKSLAAHALGFVGYQEEGRVGRSGIEGYFEEQLAGDLGFLSAERDARGGFIGVGSHELTPAQDGDDIVLTVDRVVQTFIEDELKKGVERYGAERGSIIVMDPRTGAILGMATYPTFDPNFYYAITDPRVQLNPLVSEIFEPGSILKPLVMAAALNEDKIEPSTTMVDSGPVKVAEYKIDTFDGKHAGVQTMTQVLEQSNNVGMVWVGQQLGAETMYDYFRRFGLGERTGIELDGETQTTLPEPDKWNVTTVATTSFGQGIAVTPLQALNSINALAHKGQLLEPHIVDYTKSPDGTITRREPRVVQQVVSPETAAQLSAMMVSVIEKGVGQLARVPGYYLAGKTGTAQVPDEHGRYHADRKIISFVGFGPVEDPQFSVLIKLDNPAGLSFASGTAAPMFRAISQKLLQYYHVPPSYLVE
jgi:cell division protein FtsI/penicillin-binding protein 2